MNRVVAGSYKGCRVKRSRILGTPYISGMLMTKYISKQTVERCEVLSEFDKNGGICGAVAGYAFLGVAGAIGVASQRYKHYRIGVHFKNGKTSILEVNGRMFVAIMGKTF